MSSELPQITNEQILQRLVANETEENSKLRSQNAHLALLAEALRDERDKARLELAEAQQKIEEANNVQDISSLPKK
jgi:hypothetical protein